MNRKETVLLRLTPEEKAEIEKRAKEHHMPVTVYIRDLIFNRIKE